MRSPRRPHRPTLMLEQLEDRLLLAGNLIATTEVPGVINYNLIQYTQQGALVSSQNIPQAPGANEYEDARGLSVGPTGNVNIFDGTFNPSLATLAPATQTWSFQTSPGWSLINNISYGEVAAYKNYVFASNMQSLNGVFNGILRFDSSGGSPVLFAPGTQSLQITLGLDGQLYELVGNGDSPAPNPTINVFNPDTLALVRTFQLSTPFTSDIRSIAVDAAGNVYAADWNGTVTKYDPSGNPTGASILLKDTNGFGENLMNVALDTDGQIAVGGRDGGIFLTDESLASATRIATGQWNVFVTFDHYIGGASQTVTPSFSALAGPTISYGQPSVTLGGTISAGATYPPGSVSISLNGVTKSAAISSTDGTFSVAFDTSSLGVSGSPYTITYSYAAQGNYAGITDTSKVLTVTPAVTTLGSLSSPTVVIGTAKATLSGVVGSNSVLPVGQTVTVRVAGTNIPVASGTIGSDGSFSVKVNTAALPVGAYTIQYSYAGDANFKPSQGTGTLTVTYAVKQVHKHTKPVDAGDALPIQLQVTDASGNNLSSANLTVTAVALVDAHGNTITPKAKGHDNPGNVFRHTHSGYLYNLDTTGLTAGTYTLYVRVGNDPVLHAISFIVD